MPQTSVHNNEFEFLPPTAVSSVTADSTVISLPPDSVGMSAESVTKSANTVEAAVGSSSCTFNSDGHNFLAAAMFGYHCECGDCDKLIPTDVSLSRL